MADKLKIYACTGIGDTGESQSYNYWTDNTNTVSNTQAVNTLLAQINMRIAEISSLELSKDEQAACLNDIDLYAVSLYYASAFSGNSDKIRFAGTVIGGMAANGLFQFDSIDNAERDAHLDELFATVEKAIETGEAGEPTPAFLDWWRTTVEERDKVGLTPDQQRAVQEALNSAISGIGKVDEAWKQNKDLANYLTNAGRYFIYTFFTDAQLAKLPEVFKLKKLQQKKIYNYCSALFVGVYGSKKEMDDIIYTGICSYFKSTPEKVCADVTSGARSINSLTAAIVTLITTAIAALVSIITAICQAVAKSKVAQYEAIDRQAVEAGAIAESDYEGLEITNNSGLVWIAAIAAGLWLIFKKN